MDGIANFKMTTLTLVVPKEFPTSGPLRIIMCVEGYLLHYFDPDLDENLTRDDFQDRPDRPVTRRLARMALNTCSRSQVPLSDVNIREAFMGHAANDTWGLIVKVDCAISSRDNDDNCVVYLEAKKDLNDEGNVEFIPVVPQTAKAKAKYGSYEMFPVED